LINLTVALSGTGASGAAERGRMESKARYIFPVVMTAMIVFMVTLLVTALNLGFPPDFLRHWVRAYFVTWPIAAVSAFFAIPVARRLTQRIVSAIERE